VLISLALFAVTATRRAPRPIDVIVVGGGPAGLAAAAQAQEAGASVLIIERDGALGGRARSGGGATLIAGTSTQKALGIDDSPEKALAEWSSLTGSPPGKWAEGYLRSAPAEVHDWLARKGGGWDKRGLYDFTEGTQRLHMAAGGSIAFVHALEKDLRCTVRLRTEAEKILMEQGRACGVAYIDGDGGRIEARAGAVIIATGGFASDTKRVRSLAAGKGDLLIVPDTDETREGPESRGASAARVSGLDMLEDVGALLVNLDAVGYIPQILNELTEDGKPVFLNLSRALWIDGGGSYFFPGHMAWSVKAGAGVLGAPKRTVWALFDSDEARRAFPGSPPHVVERLIARGKSALRADTLEDLARKASLDPGRIRATLKKGMCDVVSERWHRPLGFLPPSPLARPPFYAARVGLVASKCFGGVKVDLDGRVLDRKGTPIPGLYAAGEVAGMAGGDMGGTRGFDGSIGAVIYSGRVAGRSAARLAGMR
jgi:fumarate reductase flavoprotein subunit